MQVMDMKKRQAEYYDSMGVDNKGSNQVGFK